MNHTKKILLYFSCFSITLNIISCIVLRTIYPAYLIWNLFLAYLPYLFSQYLQKSIDNKRPRWVQIFLGAAWLFFFPNTIYVLTDFIHLYDQIRLPVWFDIAEIFSFTWIAFMLGFFFFTNPGANYCQKIYAPSYICHNNFYYSAEQYWRIHRTRLTLE
jgi:uncharacterized membrane protein